MDLYFSPPTRNFLSLYSRIKIFLSWPNWPYFQLTSDEAKQLKSDNEKLKEKLKLQEHERKLLLKKIGMLQDQINDTENGKKTEEEEEGKEETDL